MTDGLLMNISNAIKDDQGKVLDSHDNLNRIIANTWSFDHQGGQLIGDQYVAIAKQNQKKFPLQQRKIEIFFYHGFTNTTTNPRWFFFTLGRSLFILS